MTVAYERKPAAAAVATKPVTKDSLDEKKKYANPAWGRTTSLDWFTYLGWTSIMLFCPFLCLYFWLVCDSYQCDLSAPVVLLSKAGFTSAAFQKVLVDHLPTPSVGAFQLYFGWLVFQGLLYTYLPGKIGYGQQTPAGHILAYNVNGLMAWVVTHAVFVAGGFYFGWFSPTIIYDNWGGLFIAANVYGYFLTAFSYIKALYFPTHPEDRKFSGSAIFDIFMGVEFNPRLGEMFDFKLFHNGRPGIVAWTLINLSFAAAQYAQYGHVTNSMILVNWFHLCYVLDFFYNEDWYLRTIDIAHDHFGFYLAWGDSVWLPFMYTLQSHYLVRNPVDLPVWGALGVFALGMFGYYIFRSVNYQKDIVRRSDGKCLIWGKPAKVVRAKYLTKDGKEHTSILLASGWWGLARHFNYTGDLILSLAMCASCGVGHVLPYFYFVYMFMLLVVRIQRDDERLIGKYGKYWDDYKKLVPYNLIPYIY